MKNPDKPSGQSESAILSLAAWTARVLPGWVKRGIYRIRPLARLVRGGLNRAAPGGQSVVTVAAGVLEGMQLSLDLHTEKDFWLGTYELDLQEALKDLVKPGMTAYDVGANIGYISLMLTRLVGEHGQVYAFEALPENVERLTENLRLNGVFGGALTPTLPQVGRENLALTPALSRQLSTTAGERGIAAVISAAVVDRAGSVHFLVGPSGEMGKAEGSAGRQEIVYRETITVDGISLDEFVFQCGNPPPQVVKIDIEGGEVLALPGMRRVLQEYHPLVLIELHGPESARAAWEILQECGYRICRMEASFPSVPSLEALDWKAYLAGF